MEGRPKAAKARFQGGKNASESIRMAGMPDTEPNCRAQKPKAGGEQDTQELGYLWEGKHITEGQVEARS
jgi:hypothetical protein